MECRRAASKFRAEALGGMFKGGGRKSVKVALQRGVKEIAFGQIIFKRFAKETGKSTLLIINCI